MLEQPIYTTDLSEVRGLVHSRGWATLVTGTPTPVVSHLPVLLDPDDAEGLTLLGHLARTDAELHELGQHDVVLIVEGPDGYISPSFYQAGPYVPTWNFVVAHLHGRPEVLDAADTWEILTATVERFESDRPTPWRLDTVPDFARSIAPYTTGLRMTPSRIVGKSKLSQDKPLEVRERVIAALDTDPVHGHPALAQAMRHALHDAPQLTATLAEGLEP